MGSKHEISLNLLTKLLLKNLLTIAKDTTFARKKSFYKYIDKILFKNLIKD